MNAETLRAYTLAKKGVEECQPFGPDNLVYKIGGKVFLLVSLDAVPLQFNVKCDPDTALELRETHACVLPGYHMNKKHWNTVELGAGVPDAELRKMIDHSYDRVVAGLAKPKRGARLRRSPTARRRARH